MLKLKPKHFIEAIGIFIALCIANIPPKFISEYIGKYLGFFLYFIGVRKNVVINNFKIAFPDLLPNENKKLLKKLYTNMGIFLIEFLRFDTVKDFKITKDGEKNILDAKNLKKGTIILLGHLGNWELMGKIFATYPIKCFVVAKPMSNPIAEWVINRKRQLAGLNVIYQKDALKNIVAELKENSFVGILMDQDAGAQGVFVNFFNKPASTVPTVASLALKFGSTILPSKLIRQGKNKYCFKVNSPLIPINTGNKTDDIITNTQNYNNVIEASIKENPEQYFGWFHKRWKTQKN